MRPVLAQTDQLSGRQALVFIRSARDLVAFQAAAVSFGMPNPVFVGLSREGRRIAGAAFHIESGGNGNPDDYAQILDQLRAGRFPDFVIDSGLADDPVKSTGTGG